MFGDLLSEAKDMVTEIRRRLREIENKWDGYKDGEAMYEEYGEMYNFMDSALSSAESLVDELEVAERRFD